MQEGRVTDLLQRLHYLLPPRGGFAMAPLDRQKLRDKRSGMYPHGTGSRAPELCRSPGGGQRFLDADLLEERDRHPAMQPSECQRVSPLTLPFLPLTKILERTGDVHLGREIGEENLGEAESYIYPCQPLVDL